MTATISHSPFLKMIISIKYFLIIDSVCRDLSNNKGLKGTLPSSIGNLKKLDTLYEKFIVARVYIYSTCVVTVPSFEVILFHECRILVGCSFFGPIPESIGSLKELIYLWVFGLCCISFYVVGWFIWGFCGVCCVFSFLYQHALLCIPGPHFGMFWIHYLSKKREKKK